MKKLYVAALLTISLLLTACGTSNTPETENDLIDPPIEKTLDLFQKAGVISCEM